MNMYDVYGEWLDTSYCVAKNVPWDVALEIESHSPSYFIINHKENDGLPF